MQPCATPFLIAVAVAAIFWHHTCPSHRHAGVPSAHTGSVHGSQCNSVWGASSGMRRDLSSLEQNPPNRNLKKCWRKNSTSDLCFFCTGSQSSSIITLVLAFLALSAGILDTCRKQKNAMLIAAKQLNPQTRIAKRRSFPLPLPFFPLPSFPLPFGFSKASFNFLPGKNTD